MKRYSQTLEEIMGGGPTMTTIMRDSLNCFVFFFKKRENKGPYFLLPLPYAMATKYLASGQDPVDDE